MIDKILSKKVKAFIQHGFKPLKESGSTQIMGNCIFCGDTDDFFINHETLKWDCKKCKKYGELTYWLLYVFEFTQQYLMKNAKKFIEMKQGISLISLKNYKIGFNPLNNSFVFPIFSFDNSRVLDLEILDDEGNKYCTDKCKRSLFGGERLRTSSTSTIWLCEGATSALALHSIFIVSKENMNQHCIISTPGSSTFRGDWLQLFLNRTVRVLFDNDKAGIEGAQKIFNMLSPVARTIDFIHWPDGFKNRYDVRDFSIEKRALQELKTFFKPLPKHAEINEIIEVKYEGKKIEYQDVYDKIREWLYIPDYLLHIIDIFYAVIIANRFENDPVWLFLVGAPSTFKTELIRSLENSPGIHFESTITPTSLISGYRGDGLDTSILNIIHGKVLANRDFTSTLGIDFTAREQVFSILREAYDGTYYRRFGNRNVKRYICKFGFIAGVTPKINDFVDFHNALGERFLKAYIEYKEVDYDKCLEKATSTLQNKTSMRNELAELSKNVLSYDYKKEKISIPSEIDKKLFEIAKIISKLRGSFSRDNYTKEITSIPSFELPTRILSQMRALLEALARFKSVDKVTNDELKTIRQIAKNCISRTHIAVLELAYKNEIISAKDLTDALHLSRNTCGRLLDGFVLLGLCERIQSNIDLLSFKYKLSDTYKKIFNSVELFE